MLKSFATGQMPADLIPVQQVSKILQELSRTLPSGHEFVCQEDVENCHQVMQGKHLIFHAERIFNMSYLFTVVPILDQNLTSVMLLFGIPFVSRDSKMTLHSVITFPIHDPNEGDNLSAFWETLIIPSCFQPFQCRSDSHSRPSA